MYTWRTFLCKQHTIKIQIRTSNIEPRLHEESVRCTFTVNTHTNYRFVKIVERYKRSQKNALYLTIEVQIRWNYYIWWWLQNIPSIYSTDDLWCWFFVSICTRWSDGLDWGNPSSLSLSNETGWAPLGWFMNMQRTAINRLHSKTDSWTPIVPEFLEHVRHIGHEFLHFGGAGHRPKAWGCRGSHHFDWRRNHFQIKEARRASP